MNGTRKATKAVVVQTILLSIIHPDPDQPRKKKGFDEASLRRLGKSILKDGRPTILPIVRLHPTIPEEFMLIDGERRWRAMNIVGMTETPAEVRADIAPNKTPADKLELRVKQTIANLQREDIGPIDEAKALTVLLDGGLSYDDVEEHTGFGRQTIVNRLKLLELPREIQEMVQEERLPQLHALNLRIFKKGMAEQIRLAHELLSGVSLEMTAAEAKEKARSQKVKIVVSGTPEELLQKLLKGVVWRVPSTTGTMDAFIKIREVDRRRLWFTLAPSVRQNAHDRMVEFVQDAHELSKLSCWSE